MITEAIIILIAVLIGWFLRDLRVKTIQRKGREIKKKISPNRSEVLEWSPPKSPEQEAEEKIKKDLGL